MNSNEGGSGMTDEKSTVAWEPCCEEMERALESKFVYFAEAKVTGPVLRANEADELRETHLLCFDSKKADNAMVTALDYCPWCGESCDDDEALDAYVKNQETA
jgi:hypothetical protein